MNQSFPKGFRPGQDGRTLIAGWDEDGGCPGSGMNTSRFTVRRARWPDDIPALRRVREPVFVGEQRVPPELEWDDADPLCIHVLAEDRDNQPIGTGRLSSDGKIGRMAVLKPWRGRGVGGAILQALVKEARSLGISECRLHGQTSVLGFYARHGFTATGPEFEEAGISHRLMRLPFGNE